MILVTNDDGIQAQGIQWLAEAAAQFGETFIAAPDRERSNIGMGITLDLPLRAVPSGENAYAISGTPVDCVDLAVGQLMPRPPVLCVAGVNMGQNLGHDVHFSGTVGAARKAWFLGVPSIAFSMPRGKGWHPETALHYVSIFMREALKRGLPTEALLNVNIPNAPLGEVTGVRLTRLDPAPYDTHVEKRIDKFGGEYYWIGGKRLEAEGRHLTDFGALADNAVSVTPLGSDLTHDSSFEKLAEWRIDS